MGTQLSRGPDPTWGIPAVVEQEKQDQEIRLRGVMGTRPRRCGPHLGSFNYVETGNLEPENSLESIGSLNG